MFFFDNMQCHDQDLISYNITDIKNDPEWGWTSYIKGSRDGVLPFYKHLGCICRVSKKCIELTDEFLKEYNCDNNYYYELIWPTSVIRNNMTYFNIDDYCQTPYSPGYAPTYNIRQGKLYHAVKDNFNWNY